MHDDVRRFLECGGVRTDEPALRASIEAVLTQLPEKIGAALLAVRPYVDELTGEEGFETHCVFDVDDELGQETSTTRWRPLLVKRGKAQLLFNPKVATYEEDHRLWVVAREVARYYLGHQEFGASSGPDEPDRLAEEWGFKLYREGEVEG